MFTMAIALMISFRKDLLINGAMITMCVLLDTLCVFMITKAVS